MAAVATVKRKHPLANCEDCPLASKPCAPSQKPPQGRKVRAAIVSRSPAFGDGMAGKPFSGPSGKVLDFLLKQNGLERADVLVTNTVLCTPDAGKVPPEAIKACAPRLAHELQGIPLVVACGSEAVNELVGRGSIDRYRGQRISRDNVTYVATNNPALVLRDDSTFPNLKRDFRRAFNPLPPATFPKVEVIEDAASAKDVLREYTNRNLPIAADIESRGGLTHKATLISFQFSVEGDVAYVLGERFPEFEDVIRSELRQFLESNNTYIWHGGKFDTKILHHTYGINARVDEDTMLLSYALDERSGSDERIGVHGLEYLMMEEFGWPAYCPPSVEKAKKTGIVEDYDAFYKYAGMDAGGTFQLFERLQPLAVKDNVYEKPYRYLLLRGNRLLTTIELHGFKYDTQLAADMLEFEVNPELAKLVADMRELVDNPIFKPSSPQQVAAYFYDQWGLKHAMQERPDMKRSVDDSARREIMSGRFKFRGEMETVRTGNMVKTVRASNADDRKQWYIDFVAKYDRFQKLQKQAGTYLRGLIEKAEADEDSRIYTNLNLHGTNSGRLSSSGPNLQNITRTREGLPDIRRLFRASPGRLVVKADFSQAELRCIASFSGDKELCRIYEEGLDLHDETARRFFGENFTSEQRSICKNVNFGVFYLQGADTFQEKHNIPASKAQPYIDWVWSTFTGVKKWEDEVAAEIKTRKQLVSPFGRKRRFHLLTRENLQSSIREGINFYPQSTASDLTLSSAILLWPEIDPNRASIAILVHDDITADVEEGYVDEYKAICLEIMAESAKREIGWTLPFAADIGVGPTWGTAK